MKAGRIAWSIVAIAVAFGRSLGRTGDMGVRKRRNQRLRPRGPARGLGGLVSVRTPFTGYHTFESDTPPQTRVKENPRRMSMVSRMALPCLVAHRRVVMD